MNVIQHKNDLFIYYYLIAQKHTLGSFSSICKCVCFTVFIVRFKPKKLFDASLQRHVFFITEHQYRRDE